MKNNYSKILIIKWGALGDIVAATPAIVAVRKALPNSHITLLSNSLMKEIVPAKSIVDELIVYDSHNSNLNYNLEVIKKLKKTKFDLALNLRWKSHRSALLTYFSGAKIRASSGPENLMFLYNNKISHPVGRYHEIDRNLDIVKAAGIEIAEVESFIFISSVDQKFADEFYLSNELTKKNCVVIHPGASREKRTWKPERYIEIGKRIIEKYKSKVVVTWGPTEKNLAEKIVNEIGENAIISSDTNSIGKISAIIKNAGLFISVCTGPMNIAVALDTPVVALLGSTHPLDWSPYGKIHEYIKSPYDLLEYSEDEERKALDLITVDEVWKVVDKKLNQLII
ncbi:MAG: hypothetical protein C0425_01660 [Chlorobiaceae bacterium]|nr:hypothetical protein [Chlorobiaceae bacterium]MBA4309025.1 hypothetical protein [Chlorobiaceae bacterium]